MYKIIVTVMSVGVYMCVCVCAEAYHGILLFHRKTFDTY